MTLMIESENCEFWLQKAREAVSSKSEAYVEKVRHEVNEELAIQGLCEEEHAKIVSVLDSLASCCG